MRRIAMSLMTIAAVFALAVGATSAYFTDQAIVPNTFSAGKLDIDLRGAYASGITIPIDTTQAFTGGMAPGVPMGPYDIQVYNQGWGVSTLPAKYAWSASYSSGNWTMFSKINVVVREGNCDWFDAPWFAGQGYLYDGPLSGLNKVTSGNPIDPNITRCTRFMFTLDPSADNTLQGVNTQFNLVLDATQTNNPGWTQ